MRYLALLLLAACSPAPVSPPAPTTVDPGGCEKACAKLRELPCPEGKPQCEEACVSAVKLRPLPLDCWADAGTKEAARACGGLRCR